MSTFLKALERTYNYFTGRLELARIILIGLNASGKTTFLNTVAKQSPLLPSEVTTTIPTIGFNVEMLDIKTMKFYCWDVGGSDRIRPLWRHFMKNVCALVFFIDSNDRERWELAANELLFILNEEDLQGMPILVVANKNDLSNAMSREEIVEKFSLNSIQDREWDVLSACICNSSGVSEILEWLDIALKKYCARSLGRP